MAHVDAKPEMVEHDETTQRAWDDKLRQDRAPEVIDQLDGKGEVAIEALGGKVEDLPKGYFMSFDFIGTFLALVLGHACCFFSFILPTNVLVIINQELGPDPNFVWVAIAWNLTQAVSYVLVGRLSDLLGRRWFFIGGNCIGLVGAILACVAPSITVLIVASALTGIAAAVQLSFGVVIAELIPNKYRGYGIAAIFVAVLPVSCFAPVIVRTMLDHTAARWRLSFYINVGLQAVVILLFFFCYHPPTYEMLHARGQHRVSPRKMVDVVGVALFLAGLVLFLMGLSWGGGVYPWQSGHVIGTIVGGAALLVSFVLWEIYGAGEYPLVPMRFFRNRHFCGVVVTAGVGSMIYYSLLVIWPMQISYLFETDNMAIGWKSCIIGSAAVVGQAACGLFVKKIRHHKWQAVATITSLAIFTASMAATTEHTPSMAVAFIFLASFSLGYVETAALTVGPFCLDPADIGIAMGLIGASRSTLSCIAQAIFTTILNNGITTNLPKYVVPAAVAAGLPESSAPQMLGGLATGNFTGVPGVTPTIIDAAVAGSKTGYSESFKVVYLVSIAFGVCGILAALNVPNVEASFNDFVARKMHGTKAVKHQNDEKTLGGGRV